MLEKINLTESNKSLDLIHTASTSKTFVANDFSKEDYHDFLDIAQEIQEKYSFNDHELIATFPDKEAAMKAITRTIDLHIMPLFCVFYFMDFLDRANIGSATLGGIHSDLHLTPAQLSGVISAFYITYIMFEVPSNIILKRTNPRTWLSFIMLVWGVITLCMAFSSNFQSLLVCRLLLGAAESGYVPGILYMMSQAYRPGEFGVRVAILFSMATLSGIVSGPIAYGTAFLEGVRGLHGWQYLFIIEGVPTICLSIISYFYLFENINTVTWLTPAQKALHRECVHAQRDSHHTRMSFRTLIKAAIDWKTCLFSVVLFMNVVNLVSYQVFLPTIIDGFGFTVLTTQLLTAPPSLVATLAVIAGGLMIDKYQNKRGMIMSIGFLIASFGYMLLLFVQGRWARYACLFVIPIGMGIQTPGNLGWSAINFPRLEVRVIAVAVVIMIGNSGSVVASYLYPLNHAPNYCFGHIFNLCTALLGAVFSALTSYLLYRQNQKALALEDFEHKSEKDLYKYYY